MPLLANENEIWNESSGSRIQAVALRHMKCVNIVNRMDDDINGCDYIRFSISSNDEGINFRLVVVAKCSI